MTIYIRGDVHGYNPHIYDTVQAIKKMNNGNLSFGDTVIIAGDVGLEYGHHINKGLKEQMQELWPGKWIIMRGNHDNRYWANHTTNGKPQDGWAINKYGYLYEVLYPNIWYVRDEGGIYTIEDKNILFVPGAFSVDGDYRQLFNRCFEPREQLTRGECEHLLNVIEDWIFGNKIDYVISHTCPLFLRPYIQDLFLGFVNQEVVDETMEHFLDAVHDVVSNEGKVNWFFAHYHDDREMSIGDDKFTMLMNEVKVLD